MADSPDPRSTPATRRTSRPLLERLSMLLAGGPEDREQLLGILRDSHERQLLDADALSMFEGVLQVSDLSAGEIMVPRAQMDVVDIADTRAQIIDVVIKTAHSRFPVLDGDRDNIIGILHAKDLLRLSVEPDTDIRDLLRPAVFIPESKRLNVLLRDFRGNRNHVAIVVDEYGGAAGLITIEDVLEQIVGDIEDEFDFDVESDHIVAVDSGAGGPRFRVKAITEIDQFNERFQTNFPTDEFDTVGGLITDHFGRVPRRGDSVQLANLRFEVLRTDARQLEIVLVEILSPNALGVA
jgi:magnesium and cobalt transporter